MKVRRNVAMKLPTAIRVDTSTKKFLEVQRARYGAASFDDMFKKMFKIRRG